MQSLAFLFKFRGFITSILFCFGIVSITYLLLSPFIEPQYNIIASSLAGFIFFIAGFRTVEIVHKGVPLFLGQRVDIEGGMPEGLIWIMPWLSDIDIVSVKIENLSNIELETHTLNMILIKVNISIDYTIENPKVFITIGNINESLKNLVQDAIRNTSLEMDADDIAKSEAIFSHEILNKLKDYAKNQLGIEIIKLNLINTKIPLLISKSMEQKIADTIDMESFLELYKSMKKIYPNFTEKELINMIQIQLNKRTAISLDGQTTDDVLKIYLASLLDKK